MPLLDLSLPCPSPGHMCDHARWYVLVAYRSHPQCIQGSWLSHRWALAAQGVPPGPPTGIIPYHLSPAVRSAHPKNSLHVSILPLGALVLFPGRGKLHHHLGLLSCKVQVEGEELPLCQVVSHFVRFGTYDSSD